MCDPATIGIILGGTQVLGSQIQAKGERAAAEYSAQILEQNAKIDEMAAADAQARGGVAAGRERMQTSDVLARQKTAFAASGVRIDTGSPADVAATTRGLGELDTATIENNAALEAWGYKVAATNKRSAAAMARATGKAQELGTLMTGYTRGAAAIMGYRRGT